MSRFTFAYTPGVLAADGICCDHLPIAVVLAAARKRRPVTVDANITIEPDAPAPTMASQVPGYFRL